MVSPPASEAPQPLPASPDAFLRATFVRALGKGPTEKLALRALLKAHHLLGLALAKILVDMRAGSDPLMAAAAEAHTSAILATLLRESLSLLGDRFDKLPERQRPHYTPTQRFRILRIKHLIALSQEETARMFRVSVGTVARWEATANPASQTVGSTVTPVPPVRRYNDAAPHLVQTLTALGVGGYDLVARHLARGGWRIAASTVRRYVLGPRIPGPPIPAPQTPKRAVVARFTHHLWHLDSTWLPSLFGSTPRSLAVIFDSFSRMPLWAVMREGSFDAYAMITLVESAFGRLGKPRHLLVDRAGEFTATAFRERLDAWRVRLRFCSADHHRANSRLERFWLTLKQQLRVSRLSLPPSAAEIQRALVYYAYHRPHQGLGGATPAEVYFDLQPRHLSAVQPPRGKRGDPPVPLPAVLDFLDGDERFPVLRAA